MFFTQFVTTFCISSQKNISKRLHKKCFFNTLKNAMTLLEPLNELSFSRKFKSSTITHFDSFFLTLFQISNQFRSLLKPSNWWFLSFKKNYNTNKFFILFFKKFPYERLNIDLILLEFFTPLFIYNLWSWIRTVSNVIINFKL